MNVKSFPFGNKKRTGALFFAGIIIVSGILICTDQVWAGGGPSGGGQGPSDSDPNSDHVGCGNSHSPNPGRGRDRDTTPIGCRGKDCEGPRTPPGGGGGGGGGGGSKPKSPPTASLTCVPGTIDSGESVTLTWRCQNASSSSGTNFSTGGALTGNKVLRPTSAITYQVECRDDSRVARASCRVNVSDVNGDDTGFVDDIDGSGSGGGGNGTGLDWQLDITASPLLVQVGGQSRVSWTSSNTENCTASGPGLSSNQSNGSADLTITEESTYTLTCDTTLGGGETLESDSVTVKIIPVFREL